MLHKNSDTVFVKMKINKYRDLGTGECSHGESDLLRSDLQISCPVAVSAAAALAAPAAVALGLAHHLGFKLVHFLTKPIALPCR